jgi:hypothetical protein
VEAKSPLFVSLRYSRDAMRIRRIERPDLELPLDVFSDLFCSKRKRDLSNIIQGLLDISSFSHCAEKNEMLRL